MVRYTIPASILAMAIGVMGATKAGKIGKIGKLPRDEKAPFLTSDATNKAISHQTTEYLVEHEKLEQNNGNGNGNGRSGRSGFPTCDDNAPPGNSAGFSAVYTMTNQPNNEILVYSRDTDTGLLTFEDAVSTGGIGHGLDTTAANLPPGADPLGSSDAIVVAGNCLLAVNPASHDITSFRIKSASVLEANDPVSTGGGTWPVSIAHRDGRVYVLNAGGTGSVQGFSLNPGHCGLSPVGDLVELDQGRDVSPVDPPSILAGPAQIGFNPQGGVVVLIAALGGGQVAGFGPFADAAIGSISVFEVGSDGALDDPVSTILPRAASFPLAFDHDVVGRLLVAELQIDGITGVFGNGGVSVWEYGTDGTVSESQPGVNAGDLLTCWIKYNSRNGCSYTTNTTPTGSISTVSSGVDGVTLVESRAGEANAPIDIAVSRDGKHVYTLTNMSTNTGAGNGQPQIYVHSTACDCGMNLIQEVTDGLPSEAARIAADGRFNGVVGIATYPF